MIKVEQDGSGRGCVSSSAWVNPQSVAYVIRASRYSGEAGPINRAVLRFVGGERILILETVESFCAKMKEAWLHR